MSRYKANYNESSFYDLLGNLTAIQRYRRTWIGAFGLIDNLTMNYIGNQLIKAENAVSTSNFSDQGDFRNEVSKTAEYEYDKNGNMTKDFNKGIDTISYNSLNLPISLSIKNSLGSATNNYTYSANGKKLKVEMKFGNQTKTTDYVGNMIYENGALKCILEDGGYVENGQYHFYIQDHLGNNRVVAKADGTVIQTNHYYPFGMTFMEDNIGDPKAQPYKYGGKEFDGERGLNLYDYLARSMDAVEGRFTSVDPLCEKKPWTSPYVYCSNNPVNRIDPDGKIDIDKNTQKKYPELTKYLKELSKEWKGKSESFKTAFMEKSGLNEKQVKQMLIFGQGPKLEVVKDLKNNKGDPVNGLTDAFLVKSTSKLINSNNRKGFIKLDKQVVDMLENAKTNEKFR